MNKPEKIKILEEAGVKLTGDEKVGDLDLLLEKLNINDKDTPKTPEEPVLVKMKDGLGKEWDIQEKDVEAMRAKGFEEVKEEKE